MARLKSEGSAEIGDQDDKDSLYPQAEKSCRLRAVARTSPRKKEGISYSEECGDSEADDQHNGTILKPKMTPKKNINSKQIRLAPLQVSLSSMSAQPGLRPKGPSSVSIDSPRKPKQMNKPPASTKFLQSDVGDSSDNVPEVDADESIWCGSASSSEDSEDELPSPRKFLAISRKSRQDMCLDNVTSVRNVDDGVNKSQLSRLLASIVEPLPQSLVKESSGQPKDTFSRPGSSSDKENQNAFLRFSPPRLCKPQSIARPVTPPQSPSKSRLQSPSKTRTRISTPPHRQSLDVFWDADTVNDWNEQYSPKKILKSPRKLKFLQDDSQQSPTSSPRKAQSPSKRTKAELQFKKAFDTSKHRIAEDFFAELDAVVTAGQIGQLAASTGGVRFVWSKALNSTAGRANWRRETTKTRHTNGTSSTMHKHHASIELAEKVIDDEERLMNVIAHEFCHLANFMVSGIKDQPHGRQFKEWGRNCTAAFGHKGVKVTTKHSYEIEYKYIWQCSNEDCGMEFKRHSKSIDPNRHTCGSCRSKLVQIKPVPRRTGGNGMSGNGYAAYVKANFASVKKSMPAASQKEVMEAVAKKYRREKQAKELSQTSTGLDSTARNGAEEFAEVDVVAKALEIITIEDD